MVNVLTTMLNIGALQGIPHFAVAVGNPEVEGLSIKPHLQIYTTGTYVDIYIDSLCESLVLTQLKYQWEGRDFSYSCFLIMTYMSTPVARVHEKA